ncbi:MAG: nucleotidyltransferase family protein [Methanobrevibacter wolinii]|nr:nucleotidyltransferase family protein [Methanobrevibacter wolinii]
MPSNEFVKEIIKKDRKTFFKDYKNSQENKFKYSEELESNLDKCSLKPLIADFTEYNPLHNGHYHCLKIAKEKVPNGIFVAIVPGLFERNGRGVPYILHRRSRAEIAINVGADIVVEGPPMGIMGSGQYSLCLCKMFQALNTDFIPRGYKPFDGINDILNRISLGHGIAPKPYKIVDMDTNEVIMRDKLKEDNYVIVSFSKSLKKIGFDFKNKFIFVKRIEGVSGTLIRNSIENNNFDKVKNMMPKETISILKRDIDSGCAPLNNIRDCETILDNANNLSFEELISLNLFNDNLASKIIETRDKKPFETLNELEDSLLYGFSSNYKQRVLSILETKINKDIISNYIDKYPYNIRILDYKNEDVLNQFENKINNRRIDLWQ